ncbi:MAG: hypothetical protein A3K67_06450 [Euryarchaeota archaeon RBG_16_62_10]|nr:MAG: hypothetical protein A3K67_06450 [Euryarchaeota archaeon RBG_16_62_10]
MSDLQRSIAVLFRRKGKEILTEREFVFSASMDLRWFTPKDAQRLLDAGLTGGYLERKNGNVAPTFDCSVLDVPLDYKPSKEVLDQVPKRQADLFSEIVEKIVRARSVSKREVVSRVNKKQELLGIDVEPAALLVAGDYGLPVDSGYIERATSEILEREFGAR